MPIPNRHPFQFSRRGRHLRNTQGQEFSQTMEDRDAELEEYLGELDARIAALDDRVTALEP